MKCAKCGAELKEGCLYCSVCGHEAQMVNGYSVLEEDYLKALLTDEASKDTSSEETENQNKKAEGHHKKKKQTPWIVLGCVAAVVVVIAIGAIAYVRYQNNNSYDYQIEMAEKELVDLNYEKALSYYKNALTLSPNDINARAAMAEIYLARKEYDSALETVKANGGLNEVAITTTGNVVVQDTEGDIKQVSTDEYLNNRDKYFALKNSDLLYIRAHSDEMANKNDIFNTVRNGIGISAINKIIQGAMGKLGTMSISKEGYSYKKEGNIIQGMEYINNIVNEGADLSGMGLDGVYKTGLLNKNQYQAAKAAVQYKCYYFIRS